MGAWGSGNFENDMALDWLYEFEEEGVSAIVGMIEQVRESRDFIDADIGSMLIAACEAVAAANGAAAPKDAPEDFVGLVDAHSGEIRADASLIAECVAALDRVAGDKEKSELAGLWMDAGADHYAEFFASASDLRRRLGAS